MCEKRIPFLCYFKQQSTQRIQNAHTTWSFLDGNWHKRSAANKARKVQTFQSWICHDWIYGVKSKKEQSWRLFMLQCILTKVSKVLLIRSNCSFEGKKVFWTASHMHFAVLLRTTYDPISCLGWKLRFAMAIHQNFSLSESSLSFFANEQYFCFTFYHFFYIFLFMKNFFCPHFQL